MSRSRAARAVLLAFGARPAALAPLVLLGQLGCTGNATPSAPSDARKPPALTAPRPGVSTPASTPEAPESAGPPRAGPRIAALAAGGRHACVALADGTVQCFGDNVKGQLSSGVGIRGFLPSRTVPGVADAVAVAAGIGQSCAITRGGDVWCWGSGRTAFPGPVPPRDGLDVPVKVAIGGVTQLAFGWSLDIGDPDGCAVHSDGHVSCWGRNFEGSMGRGSLATSEQPDARPVMDLPPSSQVCVGGNFACARTSSEHVFCWGHDKSGELGDGGVASSARPIEVRGLARVAEVACSTSGACARHADGTVSCWGDNTWGDLGRGGSMTAQARRPEPVPSLSGVVRIGAADGTVCAVRTGGEVHCWGSNHHGRIESEGPLGREGAIKTPHRVGGITGAFDVAVGSSVVCARAKPDRLICWGTWDVSGKPERHEL